MAAAVAWCATMIEQANLTVLDGSELPAEADRVHHVDLDSEIGMKPKKHILRFCTKPHGLDGDRSIWLERITLP